jgi:ankyrin repeat protein
VKVLLARGADLTLRNDRGLTALDIAKNVSASATQAGLVNLLSAPQ